MHCVKALAYAGSSGERPCGDGVSNKILKTITLLFSFNPKDLACNILGIIQMKHFFELNKSAYLSHLVYVAKLIVGVIVCYILYKSFPQYPFYWSLVSVVLAISIDNNNNQAYDRIKANTLGCAVGIALYPIQLPELALICIGITLTIFLGIGFKISGTIRSALAALIIITLQVEQTKHWYIALERVVCVVAGCLVALLITVIFNWVKPERWFVKKS